LITQVYVNWRNRLEETYDTTPKILEAYYDQVVECIEIAVSSMEDKRESRPTIAQIVSRLDVTEAAIEKVRDPIWLICQQKDRSLYMDRETKKLACGDTLHTS
jgi:hypothetical protein